MPIKIGWSEVDITPTRKIRLQGQFYERVSDIVESPVTVTAFALESGDEQLIMCSCDLVGIGNNLHSKVIAKLKAEYPDVPYDKVIISAIHTHTSYAYDYEHTDNTSSLKIVKNYLSDDITYVPLVESTEAMSSSETLEFLIKSITKVIVDAWKNRTEAYYANAFGRAAVGMCRRVCYDDGSAQMWGDTNSANFTELECGNDSGIELMFTFDANKKLTGVIANIACPAQVVEQRSFISSDYWGKVKDNLREKYGNDLFVLGLCSAAGDQCPRDMIRWVNPETPIDDPNVKREVYIERTADPSMFDVSGLKLVGRRISNEISLIFDDGNFELKNEGVLKHENVDMILPLRRATIKEYNDSVAALEKFNDKHRGMTVNHFDMADNYIYGGNIARYEFQKTHENVHIESHIVRFGDIAITTNPFELFLDYGNQIRARSKAKQTFIIQLACGNEGYLPTEKAEKGSHYSAYISSGTVGHAGGEAYVRNSVEKINEFFKD